jgi:glucosamine 6-phosphate synthetase-like amidotransferase/phosphosugar isomerase protein
MCGIFSYYSKNSSQKEIIKLIDAAKQRGQDSYGMTVIQDDFSENFYSDKIEIIKNKVKNKIINGSESLIIFNARLVTNGRNVENSQPVVTKQISAVHNGIICNFTNLNKHLSIELNFDPSDSVLLAKQISTYLGKKSYFELNSYLNSLKGEINLIFFCNLKKEIYYYTNSGSLYFSENDTTKILSSEILNLNDFSSYVGNKIKLNRLLKIDQIFQNFNLDCSRKYSEINKHSNIVEKISSNLFYKVEKKIENLVSTLKRCTKCVLPETYPFIKFDENGLCNFCKNFKKKKF